MKLAILGLVAAGALGAVATPASAAPSQWTVALYEAGRCIVERDRGTAQALMQSLPLDESPAELGSLRGPARQCVEGAEGATAFALRGAIAQALYLRDFRGRELRPIRAGQLVSFDIPVQASPRGSRTVELYRWADCVVRNDSEGTRRLLMSALGSSEEEAAIAGLADFMSSCLPTGTDLNVYVNEVRPVFAQSAYSSLYRYWTGQLSGTGRTASN
jgi:hypothetical protein